MSLGTEASWDFIARMKSAEPWDPEGLVTRQEREAEATAREMTQKLQSARYTSDSGLDVSTFAHSRALERLTRTDQNSATASVDKDSQASKLSRLHSQVQAKIQGFRELSEVWQKLSDAVKDETGDIPSLLNGSFPRESYDLSQRQSLSNARKSALVAMLDGRVRYVDGEIAELEKLSKDIATYELAKLENEGWVIPIR